jgi:threonine dehydrogenase-like Zn-dependent dehydrogenase
VLVEVAVCGLCNWEQNHWLGHLGTCPQTLGHEWAGTVAEVGPGVSGLAIGDRVTGLPDSLSAFADYLTVGAANCYTLAPGIDPAQALADEFARTRRPRIRLAHRAEQGHRGGRRASLVFARPDRRHAADGIISHRFPLARIQEAFETLEHKPADYIKGVVIP